MLEFCTIPDGPSEFDKMQRFTRGLGQPSPVHSSKQAFASVRGLQDLDDVGRLFDHLYNQVGAMLGL